MDPGAKRVVVTGGSGKGGRAVVRELAKHGYQISNVDRLPPAEPLCPYLTADLTDLGQAFEALGGAVAVVHMAAIPGPDLSTDEVTFRNNIMSTYNIFSAATALGLGRVVWASSETILGLPFERERPAYAPIDEDHPLYPESSYSLSKLLGEEMARQFSRWSGIPFVGLRFSNILEPEDYQSFPGYWKDPGARKWNLWSYVDARDVAQSCRLGLEAPIEGAEVFIIAADDTVMNRPNQELMDEAFPGVALDASVGEFGSLLSTSKARQMLGYEPRHSWRNHL